jgi:putative addiction module component (TIGR02574 family)
MSSSSSDILDAALGLSDQERAGLAYRLLQSLKPAGVPAEDDAFDAELQRRVNDYEAGRTHASDWDEVAARLEAKLREKKAP